MREGSFYCLPVCVKMVLAFYGHQMSIKRIASDMEVTSKGIDAFSVGTFLLNMKFRVTIQKWLYNFPNRFMDLTSGVEKELLQWCRRSNTLVDTYDRSDISEKLSRKRIQHFIESGGRLVPKPVSSEKIREAIENHHPPLLCFDVSTIYKLRPKNVRHCVIPVQMTNNEITIVDPYKVWNGGTYPIELVLHACHMYCGESIFIEPR